MKGRRRFVRSKGRPWVAALGALVAAGLAAESLAQSITRSSLSRTEIRRLVYDLQVDGARLVEETRDHLERTRRWQPAGADLDLWRAVQDFEDGVRRIDRNYSGEVYRGFDEDTRSLLERGRQVDRALDRTDAGVDARETWSRLRRSLVGLADSYGWDYASGRFTDPVERPSTRPPTTAVDDRDDRDRVRDDRRYTSAEDREVGRALETIEREAGLAVRYARVKPAGDAGDLFQGIGESLLRDVTGVQRREDLPYQQLQTDLAALEAAAKDASQRFDTRPRASEVRPEVQSMLRLGRRIQAGVDEVNISKDTGRSWLRTREQLDALAKIYELDPISTE